eukprot:2786234-Pyramimonas_sp.AAC.1
MQKARMSLQELTVQVKEEASSPDSSSSVAEQKAREERREMLGTTMRGTPLPPVAAAIVRPPRGIKHQAAFTQTPANVADGINRKFVSTYGVKKSAHEFSCKP